MSKEQEAYSYIKKADEKQNPGFMSKLFSSQESRLEESLDYLEKAANIFKMLKKWEEAGKTWERCANIQKQLRNEPASFYLEASHCFSFVDTEISLKSKLNAIASYVDGGRFQLAGKIQKEVAETFKNQLDYMKAAEAFKQAADYFSMESMNCRSYQQSCLIEYADLMCCQDNNPKCYPECSNVFF